MTSVPAGGAGAPSGARTQQKPSSPPSPQRGSSAPSAPSGSRTAATPRPDSSSKSIRSSSAEQASAGAAALTKPQKSPQSQSQASLNNPADRKQFESKLSEVLADKPLADAAQAGDDAKAGAAVDAMRNKVDSLARQYGASKGDVMVEIARNEIGVSEDNGSNESTRVKQYRAATDGALKSPGPWCNYFTSFVARAAGVPIGEDGKGEGLVSATRSWAESSGKWMSNDAKPNPGDMLTFRGESHIGIVESVDSNGTIHTIEGNSSDQVIRHEYADRSQIDGFVSMSGGSTSDLGSSSSSEGSSSTGSSSAPSTGGTSSSDSGATPVSASAAPSSTPAPSSAPVSAPASATEAAARVAPEAKRQRTPRHPTAAPAPTPAPSVTPAPIAPDALPMASTPPPTATDPFWTMYTQAMADPQLQTELEQWLLSGGTIETFPPFQQGAVAPTESAPILTDDAAAEEAAVEDPTATDPYSAEEPSAEAIPATEADTGIPAPAIDPQIVADTYAAGSFAA